MSYQRKTEKKGKYEDYFYTKFAFVKKKNGSALDI